MEPASATQIETIYPLDPANLRTFFSNHINIQYLPEEVYLDFCTIQLQGVNPKDVKEGVATRVPATAFARVVLSREHAKRLAHVLQQALNGPLGAKK